MILDFEFYVGNLERAMIALLKDGNSEINQPGMGKYCKEFAGYSGELDDKQALTEVLKKLAPRFPLVLVSYGSGMDQRKAATNLLREAPIEFEHTCSFVVIAASKNLRGEKVRRNEITKMVADVRQLLGGVQFEIADGADEPIPLNHQPLMYAGVETIARLSDLSAYAVHFTTMFKEWTPDRRVVTVRAEEILLDVSTNVENDENEKPPTVNLPGVSGETKT